jgi:cation diffusion facilitator CzcD-associated flavoprotein CzcO
LCRFSDLPFEEDLPSFVQHTEVARYLRRYADVFDLRPLIRFNTEVLHVERLSSLPHATGDTRARLGLWEVTHARHRSSAQSSRHAENDEHSAHDVDCLGHVRDGNDTSTTTGAQKDGSTTTDRFDIVLVCNGHFSKAFAPAIEGLDTFPGMVTHSKCYREPTPFADKTVVMVGGGASGVGKCSQPLHALPCYSMTTS